MSLGDLVRQAAREAMARKVPPPATDILPAQYQPSFRRCDPCDVTWHGDPQCWNCGQPPSN